MKRFLVSLALLFSMNTSASSNCEKFTDLTTKTIAFTLNCRNQMEIRSDVADFSYKMGCPQPEDKGVICMAVAKAGVYVVKKQIPHNWLCNPDIAMKILETGFTKACVSLTGL
jgi:hypothetical protein